MLRLYKVHTVAFESFYWFNYVGSCCRFLVLFCFCFYETHCATVPKSWHHMLVSCTHLDLDGPCNVSLVTGLLLNSISLQWSKNWAIKLEKLAKEHESWLLNWPRCQYSNPIEELRNEENLSLTQLPHLKLSRGQIHNQHDNQSLSAKMSLFNFNLEIKDLK